MHGSDTPFDIERLIEQFTQPTTGDVPVDVFDTGEGFVVLADVPGRDPDAIEVSLEDDRILHVEVPERDPADGESVLRGRDHGAATRAVTLPAAVAEDETEATYDQGVLRVHLGKQGGDTVDIEVD